MRPTPRRPLKPEASRSSRRCVVPRSDAFGHRFCVGAPRLTCFRRSSPTLRILAMSHSVPRVILSPFRQLDPRPTERCRVEHPVCHLQAGLHEYHQGCGVSPPVPSSLLGDSWAASWACARSWHGPEADLEPSRVQVDGARRQQAQEDAQGLLPDVRRDRSQGRDGEGREEVTAPPRLERSQAGWKGGARGRCRCCTGLLTAV